MAAPEKGFSITGWLDPAFKYFAEQAGIPVDQYSAQVGGEGIGVGLEAVADFFTKGWLNKAIQAAAGLIGSSYAVWGKDVPTRLRRELLAVGTHELLRIADPKPQDIVEVRRSVTEFVDAVMKGDWNSALASVLRTPGEIQAALGISPPATPAKPAGAKPAETPAKPAEEALLEKEATEGGM